MDASLAFAPVIGPFARPAQPASVSGAFFSPSSSPASLALQMAIKRDDLEAARFAVERGAAVFPDEAGGQQTDSLAWAARRGSARCLSWLIESHAPPPGDERWGRALVAALSGEQDRCAELLLPHVDLAAPLDGDTVFLAVVYSGRLGPIEALLTPEIGLARHGEASRTALMSAAASGAVDGVRALLRVSDPNARDTQGRTALMIAAQGGQTETTKLLAPVSDPDAQDAHGLTAAMLWTLSPRLRRRDQIAFAVDLALLGRVSLADHSGKTIIDHVRAHALSSPELLERMAGKALAEQESAALREAAALGDGAASSPDRAGRRL
jgi:hypothetical protein